MSYEITKFDQFADVKNDENDQIQNLPLVRNRMEALKMLSLTLLREIETLKENINPESNAIETVRVGEITLEREVQKYEVELIRCALLRTGRRQRRAAKLLNVKISTLNAKIRRHGIAVGRLEFALG